jgi:hypothetical protein
MNQTSSPNGAAARWWKEHAGLICLVASLAAWYVPMLVIKIFFHRKQEFMSHIQSSLRLIIDFRHVEPHILAHSLFHIITAMVMKVILWIPDLLRVGGAALLLFLLLAYGTSLIKRRLPPRPVIAITAVLVLLGSLIAGAVLFGAGADLKNGALFLWHFIQSEYPRLAGIVVLTAAYIWCGVIIFRSFESILSTSTTRHMQTITVLLTLGVMIASHIPLLFFLDDNIYFGYIGLNVYNNATTNFLKPFALAATLAVFGFLNGTSHSRRAILFAGAMIALSTLTKPNYIICLLPALSLLIFKDLLQKKSINWKSLLPGVFFPAAVVLFLQFLLTYYGEKSSILWMPFYVIRFYSNYIGVKILLSILFPLVFILLFPLILKNDRRVQLTWIMFLVAMFYYLFLAENAGGSFEDGNFGWGAEITLFLLFFVSTLTWVEKIKVQPRPYFKDYLLLLLWLIHIASGILYYAFTLSYDTLSYFTL